MAALLVVFVFMPLCFVASMLPFWLVEWADRQAWIDERLFFGLVFGLVCAAVWLTGF